jgi:hypothetical protein
MNGRKEGYIVGLAMGFVFGACATMLVAVYQNRVRLHEPPTVYKVTVYERQWNNRLHLTVDTDSIFFQGIIRGEADTTDPLSHTIVKILPPEQQ